MRFALNKTLPPHPRAESLPLGHPPNPLTAGPRARPAYPVVLGWPTGSSGVGHKIAAGTGGGVRPRHGDRQVNTTATAPLTGWLPVITQQTLDRDRLVNSTACPRKSSSPGRVASGVFHAGPGPVGRRQRAVLMCRGRAKRGDRSHRLKSNTRVAKAPRFITALFSAAGRNLVRDICGPATRPPPKNA